MERGSDKHTSRIDEELKQATEPFERGAPVGSRIEEFRDQEAPGDDEPVPDARLTGGEAVTDAALAPDELEARSDLARFLQPAVFPASRADLLASAEEEHAPPAILSQLQRLPEGETFENVQQVWTALGGSAEHRF